MKISSLYSILIAMLFLMNFTVSFRCYANHYKQPHYHPRPRPCWRKRYRKYYVPPCYRNRYGYGQRPGKKVDVKNFTNSFKGTAIHSQINMSNGGKKNVQANSTEKADH